MKKILSIALGEISTGELSIANSFEKGLDKRKYKIDYLIPKSKIGFFDDGESCRIYTVSRGKKAIDNQNYILNLINNNNYDLIILFDVFTLEYGQEWTGVNFEILSSLDIPIASIDEYEYTKAGYKLDYYGMFVKRLPGLLEKCDYIIKNCPLTMPKSKDNCFQQGKKSNEYYYRVFNNLLKIEDKEKREIREKYIRNEENKKIVFFTTSQWEIEGAYSFSSQNTLTKWILPALYNYLCMLDKEIVLLHVGSTIWENNFHNTKVEYIHHPGLPVDLFEKTL